MLSLVKSSPGWIFFVSLELSRRVEEMHLFRLFELMTVGLLKRLAQWQVQEQRQVKSEERDTKKIMWSQRKKRKRKRRSRQRNIIAIAATVRVKMTDPPEERKRERMTERAIVQIAMMSSEEIEETIREQRERMREEEKAVERMTRGEPPQDTVEAALGTRTIVAIQEIVQETETGLEAAKQRRGDDSQVFVS
jgi:hypothetical protein